VRDVSPMACILSQYEEHLRSERGLVTHTILQYSPSFVGFLSSASTKDPSFGEN
jgi:hypothetical protein